MNILIIEDSNTVAHIISSVLSTYDYRCTIIDPRSIYTELSQKRKYSIFIINTSLKKMQTPILLRTIKNRDSNAYVIGISTKGTWKENVAFLNSGGDDVLDYPFPIQELAARVQSVLRRPRGNNGGVLRHGDIEVDTNIRSASIGEKELPLRKKEFSLLEYLVRNKGRVVSRAELLDHVWDYRRSTISNTVDVHVKRLRDKIDKKNLIETVHGFGYTIRDKKRSLKHHRHYKMNKGIVSFNLEYAWLYRI